MELLEPGVFPPPLGEPGRIGRSCKRFVQCGAARHLGGRRASSRPAPSAALCELAELLQAPVITTGRGRAPYSDAHYLSLGVARGPTDPLRELFRASDLVLAVGTRFATAQADPGQQVVQVDIDPEEIGRNHDRTLGVVADARVALEHLCALLKQNGHQRRRGARRPKGSARSATTLRLFGSPKRPSFERCGPLCRTTACWWRA